MNSVTELLFFLKMNQSNCFKYWLTYFKFWTFFFRKCQYFYNCKMHCLCLKTFALYGLLRYYRIALQRSSTVLIIDYKFNLLYLYLSFIWNIKFVFHLCNGIMPAVSLLLLVNNMTLGLLLAKIFIVFSRYEKEEYQLLQNQEWSKH